MDISAGNFPLQSQQSSSPGESHPQALPEPDVTVSRHPAPIIQPTANGLVLSTGSSHFWLTFPKPDDTAPSLHSHYRSFITTTNCSAPVLRIGTLILMGPPLGFLPWHRNDRFRRSTQKPETGSRHLYAGRRSGSKQVSPELIPEYHKPPVLTSSLTFRHLISGSLALASLNHI